MWGGLSFDMYNVFRNVMHGLHLVGALDSGKVQEAGTLSGPLSIYIIINTTQKSP